MCEKVDDKLIPFYIGKGEAYRVWDHEAGQEKEINAIKEMYEEYEWQERIEELSLKCQKITELGADKIENVFIKFGMKENEALMAESEGETTCECGEGACRSKGYLQSKTA